MAERKSLGEIAQKYRDNNQGDFEEYRNRKGKTLPGYTPTTGSTGKAQYLQESGAGESQQSLEAEMSEAEKKAQETEDRSDEREDEYQESVSSTVQDEFVTSQNEEERIVRIRRQVSHEILTDEEQHKRLEGKLDAFLAAEYQRRKDLYAIENTKKNTLDYAYKVYGDQADVDAILDSAQDARRVASPEVHSLSEQLSVGIDNKVNSKDQVTVVTESGHVHIMDREVAEALQVYTQRSNGTRTLAEQFMAGAPEHQESDIAGISQEVEKTDRYIRDDFEFTRHEEEKLAELQRLVNETDKEADKFAQKAPQAMTPEEYAEFTRERRFKEFGYPDRNVQYDYVMTYEGTYAWNGRQLPSAMSSPTMNREMQAQPDREHAAPSV